jgi:hypothetical protein
LENIRIRVALDHNPVIFYLISEIRSIRINGIRLLDNFTINQRANIFAKENIAVKDGSATWKIANLGTYLSDF